MEIGERSIIGINLRMIELTAAFAQGKLHKLDRILALLKAKKAKFKQALIEAKLAGTLGSVLLC